LAECRIAHTRAQRLQAGQLPPCNSQTEPRVTRQLTSDPRTEHTSGTDQQHTQRHRFPAIEPLKSKTRQMAGFAGTSSCETWLRDQAAAATV